MRSMFPAVLIIVFFHNYTLYLSQTELEDDLAATSGKQKLD